jgi:hypothetical protein
LISLATLCFFLLFVLDSRVLGAGRGGAKESEGRLTITLVLKLGCVWRSVSSSSFLPSLLEGASRGGFIGESGEGWGEDVGEIFGGLA